MFKIFEQREPRDRKPFRIIETTKTLDGPRDRITNFTFTTMGEAEDFVRAQAGKANGHS